jgi:hypothetical protein
MAEPVQYVQVQFADCDVGWIHFKVNLGPQCVDVRASEVFDPFPDLLAWLEAIAVGVQECAFELDEEGGGKRFQFRCITYGGFVFSMSDVPDVHVLLTGKVNPRQLVSAFYHGLREFAHSAKYKRAEWEIETLGERLASSFDPPMRQDDLLGYLMVMGAEEMKELFFKAAPSYEVSFPEAKDKREEISLFVDYAVDRDNTETTKGMVRTPQHWCFPDGFDFLPERDRAEYIIQCLKEQVSSFDGTRLGDMQSAIIENWLAKE